MSFRLYFFLFLVSNISWAGGFDKDLSTTLGWFESDARADAAADIASGELHLFSSGGIACRPIGIPMEYRKLIEGIREFGFRCSCVLITPRSEEEGNRIALQWRYVRLYNELILNHLLGGDIDPSDPMHIAGKLPGPWEYARSDFEYDSQELETIKTAVVIPEVPAIPGFEMWFRFLQSLNAVDEIRLAGATPYALGRWKSAAIYNPDQTTAYLLPLDGYPVHVTPVSSEWDHFANVSHVTLLVSGNELGWGRLVVQGNSAAVGTLYVGGRVYRLLSYAAPLTPTLIYEILGNEPPLIRGRRHLVTLTDYPLYPLEQRHLEIESLRQSMDDTVGQTWAPHY